MATTDSNSTLFGETKVPILLGTSVSFSVQNKSNVSVGWTVKDSGNEGGLILPREIIIVNYDIEVWCSDAEATSNIHIVRG